MLFFQFLQHIHMHGLFCSIANITAPMPGGPIDISGFLKSQLFFHCPLTLGLLRYVFILKAFSISLH